MVIIHLTYWYNSKNNDVIPGPRIVLGREDSPASRLPHEVLSQYNGKSREVDIDHQIFSRLCSEISFYERFIT